MQQMAREGLKDFKKELIKEKMIVLIIVYLMPRSSKS